MIGLTLLWWMGLDGIRPGTSVEGQLYLLGGVSALTHDHLDMSPDGGMLCRQIGHRDPLTQRRGGGPAGHHPHFAPIDHDRVAMAGDRLVAPQQADQPATRPNLLHRRERGAADELPPLHLHDATKVGLVRVDRSVELVAVQRHARLEPQRIATAEAARLEAKPGTSRGQRLPETDGAARGA